MYCNQFNLQLKRKTAVVYPGMFTSSRYADDYTGILTINKQVKTVFYWRFPQYM